MLDAWPSNEKFAEVVRKSHEQNEEAARSHPATTWLAGYEVPTVMGLFGVSASAYGVALSFFPGFDEFTVIDQMDKYAMGYGSCGRHRALFAGIELMGYLLGEIQKLESPVDLSCLSLFAQEVLRATMEIRYGEIATYAEIAKRVGRPRSTAAVHQVLRHNPVPIFVPCHRVVASDGNLGSFCADGEWKRWLLRHEAEHAVNLPRA